MTPTEEAAYALDNRLDRDGLSKEARAEYDRLLQERFFAATRGEPAPLPVEAVAGSPPGVPGRSSPETRARILRMFKQVNSKYAKPFETDRLAVLSVMGGNWGGVRPGYAPDGDSGHLAVDRREAIEGEHHAEHRGGPGW